MVSASSTSSSDLRVVSPSANFFPTSPNTANPSLRAEAMNEASCFMSRAALVAVLETSMMLKPSSARRGITFFSVPSMRATSMKMPPGCTRTSCLR